MATYTYEPQELYFDINGGTQSVSLNASDYDVIKVGWTLKTGDSWYTTSIYDPLYPTTTLTITVESNDSNDRRDDEIKIFFNDDYVGTLLITQEKVIEPGGGGESGDDEDDERVTITPITGFTSSRILSRKVFNSQLRNNYFTSDTDKCVKVSDIVEMSWSSSTIGYSIKIDNLDNYVDTNKLLKCGDVYRENTILEKTLQYTINFGSVTVGNTNISTNDPNWEQQKGETYACDTQIMFRAYDASNNIVYEQLVDVHLEGITDAGAEWIYSINGSIDSVYFTAKEFNPCTVCYLEPYEYIDGVSYGSYRDVPANEYNTIYWGDVTIELMTDK